MSDRKSTTPAAVIRFACPRCGTRLAAAAEHAGESSACPDCGTRVFVPAPPKPKRREPDFSDVFGFSCRRCGTRLHARPKHVGKKMRCPDCEVLTVVPPPETPPKKPPPKAMDGAQYEVYQGDEQPWGSELAKRQPELVKVACHVCGTVLHAPLSAVGKSVQCPDCEAATLIAPPEAPRPPAARAVDTGPDYEVEALDPAEASVHAHLFEDATRRPPAGYRDLGERDPRTPKSRPKPPPAALLRGWLRFWGYPAMLVAWAGLSLGLLFTLGFLTLILTAMSVGMFTAIILLSGPIISGMIWWGVAAYLFFEIVIDASEGDDRVENWPGVNLYEWVGPGLNLLVAVLVAAAPGYALEQYAPDGYVPMLATLIGTLLLPWVLLSQLETGATFGVFSPRLALSLYYAPLSWVAFYAIAFGVDRLTVVIAEVVAANVKGWELVAVLAVSPLLATFWFLCYARLLGRLAWVIGESVPNPESDA